MAPGLDEFDVLLEVVLSLVRVKSSVHKIKNIILSDFKNATLGLQLNFLFHERKHGWMS